MEARKGSAVVIIAGRYTNEPAMVIETGKATLGVLLGRTGNFVTVRRSSVDIYN